MPSYAPLHHKSIAVVKDTGYERSDRVLERSHYDRLLRLRHPIGGQRENNRRFLHLLQANDRCIARFPRGMSYIEV